MIDWIETKKEPPPKKGEQILIYQDGKFAAARWVDTSTEHQEEVSRKGKTVTYEWVTFESGYWDGDGEIYDPSHWAKLTHLPTEQKPRARRKER